MNKQMNTKKKGEINRYMRKVRHLLPTMHKAERKFITNLRQDIEEIGFFIKICLALVKSDEVIEGG